jgi:DNA-binding NtrC family response regulator
MAVLAPRPLLGAEHLPTEVLGGGPAGVDDLLELPWEEALRAFKSRLVRASLDRCGGNQTQAAERLGLQRSYLNRLIKELDSGEEGAEGT